MNKISPSLPVKLDKVSEKFIPPVYRVKTFLVNLHPGEILFY
jgi:hypothetical protein